MTPATARSLFVAGICLLVGGALGGYATSLVYGDSTEDVDPAPTRLPTCPPCPACPTCPPPVDCGELGTLPSDSAPTAILPPDDDGELRKPGLPASAIKMASEAVLESIDPCLVSDEIEGQSGVVLLDLTVTATGGQGFISEALVTRRTGEIDNESLEGCLVDNARRAKFEWKQSEGELKFKLPVEIGNL